ncbi:MAG: hypothetical protein IPP72_02540 [Chitinophagaceae bacterium]|nr:hypothetical protein [Chitinophagaceae bacterium]
MKIFTTLFLLLLHGLYAGATTWNITVSNFQFSPANIPNVLVGDIIKFNFGGANFHNATSTPMGSVPPGAAAIHSGNAGQITTSYSYTVTRPGSYRYYCEIHSADGETGMIGSFTASGVVPVQLKNFDVTFSSKMVTANWQTASEQNLAYFSLQKSTNGVNYSEAGRVAATGNTDQSQSYSFKDEQIDVNTRYMYYLLKTVNRDGSYSLSSVKLIRNDAAIKKIITQMGTNPVSKQVGHLMFQFNADRITSMRALVIDASGKPVLKLDLSANKGINNGHIHMSELPTGIYTVLFSLDGLKETRKVLLVE